LEIERLGGEVRPDPKKYPEFDADLQKAMRAEVSSVFNYIVQTDSPLLQLIDSDYTFANEKLAKIYGLSGVTGVTMQKVALPNHDRGGVTGMAAVHTLSSFP